MTASPPEQAERYPFWGYSDLLLFAGLVLPCMLIGIGLVRVVMFLLHVHAGIRAAELLPEQFVGYTLLFGALILLFRVQYNRPFWRSLAWTEPPLPLGWIGLMGVGAALGVSILASLLRTPNATNPMTQLLQDPVSMVLVATFGVTLGPLCEELAFRGLLQPLLVRDLGAVPGILAAAVPFGLLHYQEYGNSWRHALLVCLAGAAFGWMRHVTGSTKAAVIMHASYNALFFVALFAARKVAP